MYDGRPARGGAAGGQPSCDGAYAIAVFCTRRAAPRGRRARGLRRCSSALGERRELPRAPTRSALVRSRTDQIVYLEEGDVRRYAAGQRCAIVDADGKPVERAVRDVQSCTPDAVELGPYRHYMQKEIFEQPRAIADTLEGVAAASRRELFGAEADASAAATSTAVLILACGTSYYAGLIAKLLARVARAACRPASRSPANTATATSVPNPNTLVVAISQSGETADTLAALKHAQALGMRHTLAICNVADQRDGARVPSCRY